MIKETNVYLLFKYVSQGLIVILCNYNYNCILFDLLVFK